MLTTRPIPNYSILTYRLLLSLTGQCPVGVSGDSITFLSCPTAQKTARGSCAARIELKLAHNFFKSHKTCAVCASRKLSSLSPRFRLSDHHKIVRSIKSCEQSLSVDWFAEKCPGPLRLAVFTTPPPSRTSGTLTLSGCQRLAVTSSAADSANCQRPSVTLAAADCHVSG